MAKIFLTDRALFSSKSLEYHLFYRIICDLFIFLRFRLLGFLIVLHSQFLVCLFAIFVFFWLEEYGAPQVRKLKKKQSVGKKNTSVGFFLPLHVSKNKLLRTAVKENKGRFVFGLEFLPSRASCVMAHRLRLTTFSSWSLC